MPIAHRLLLAALLLTTAPASAEDGASAGPRGRQAARPWVLIYDAKRPKAPPKLSSDVKAPKVRFEAPLLHVENDAQGRMHLSESHPLNNVGPPP